MVCHLMNEENPEKKFYPVSERAICSDMKLNTLEKVLWSMEDMQGEIKVEEEIRIKAQRAVERMIEIV